VKIARLPPGARWARCLRMLVECALRKPFRDASRSRGRERLHAWKLSFLLASSRVAVVAGATYLALACRCHGEPVMPLGRRLRAADFPVTTRAPPVVAGGARACLHRDSLPRSSRWRLEMLSDLGRSAVTASAAISMPSNHRYRLRRLRLSTTDGARVVTGKTAVRISSPERHDDAHDATRNEREVLHPIHHGSARVRHQVAGRPLTEAGASGGAGGRRPGASGRALRSGSA